jgi:AbrB family looped-hinge helix DNA binding protein
MNLLLCWQTIDKQTSISYNILIDQRIEEEAVQTTVSSKFQVVIPKPVREHLKLRPQQKLTVIEKDGMLIMMPQRPLDELRGVAIDTKVDDYRDKKDRF